MENPNYQLSQQNERPKWERDLPQYARDDLDRRREKRLQNSVENPAIMEMLGIVNDKLDRLLKLLENR